MARVPRVVVWHPYQNIVNPDVYPMNWTWLTGKNPEGQLRHEHYLEWAKIVEAESRAEEAAREAVEHSDAAKEQGESVEAQLVVEGGGAMEFRAGSACGVPAPRLLGRSAPGRDARRGGRV